MVIVEVANTTKERAPVQQTIKTLKKVFGTLCATKEFSFLNQIHISVAFVGKTAMKNLNWRWRRVNKATDVLSFVIDKDRKKLVGEIILCAQVIHRKEYGRDLRENEKMNYVLIHAALHLCGFDHEKDADWKKMERVAQKLWNTLYAR